MWLTRQYSWPAGRRPRPAHQRVPEGRHEVVVGHVTRRGAEQPLPYQPPTPRWSMSAWPYPSADYTSSSYLRPRATMQIGAARRPVPARHRDGPQRPVTHKRRPPKVGRIGTSSDSTGNALIQPQFARPMDHETSRLVHRISVNTGGTVVRRACARQVAVRVEEGPPVRQGPWLSSHSQPESNRFRSLGKPPGGQRRPRSTAATSRPACASRHGRRRRGSWRCRDEDHLAGDAA
jgi:hypothetical protein